MRRGYLLLDEAPNESTAGRPDLWLLPDASGVPHSANRLLEIAGFSHRDFRRMFPMRRFPMRSTFPVELARARVPEILRAVHDASLDGIVVLGKRAASAFRWIAEGDLYKLGRYSPRGDVPIEWFRWAWATDGTRDSPPAHAVVVPHPSPVNRLWNDEATRRRAREFFSALRQTSDEFVESIRRRFDGVASISPSPFRSIHQETRGDRDALATLEVAREVARRQLMDEARRRAT